MADKKGFYPNDSNALKFDVNKDISEIRFNQYLMQKENIQRLKKELPRGQFYLTINGASLDLNLTFGTVRSLIKKFVDLDIIRNIYKPPKGNKSPSIYAYNTVFLNNEENNDTNNDTINDKSSKINAFKTVNNNEENNEGDNDINNSKKDNIKKENKKKIFTSDSYEYRLANYLLQSIKSNNPDAKEPDLQKWAECFGFMIRLDNRKVEEIKQVIEFSQKHPFWYKNVLSAGKLRIQYDRLILEMKESKPTLQQNNETEYDGWGIVKRFN